MPTALGRGGGGQRLPHTPQLPCRLDQMHTAPCAAPCDMYSRQICITDVWMSIGWASSVSPQSPIDPPDVPLLYCSVSNSAGHGHG